MGRVSLAMATLFVLGLSVGLPSRVSADPPKPAHVSVLLREMSIEVRPASIPAGPVVFDITNAGAVTHELVALQTDIPDGALPPGEETGKANEAGDLGEAEDIAPGATATLSLTLSAGRYVLICNLPGHYAAGMHAPFVVTSSVSATLKEMSIQLDRPVAVAGGVTFTIANAGAMLHELVILRTDIPEGSLMPDPTEAGRVKEDGWVGESEDIAPGAVATVTLPLAPGRYVLVCNYAGHYAAGMHASFVVVPSLDATVAAAIDRELAVNGISVADQAARVDIAALLRSPGVIVSDADRAAIAAGLIPRAVLADGTLVY